MISITPSTIVIMELQGTILMKFLFMFLTSITKPGYLKLNEDSEEGQSLISEEEREKRKAGVVCSDCCSRRTLRTVHCSKCYRCIIRYDHHSDLFNTCIGYDNQIYYFFFLIFSLLESYLCCFSIVRYLHLDVLFPHKASLIWSLFCLSCIVSITINRLLL